MSAMLFFVCSLQPCGHLMGKDDLLGILCPMFSDVFVNFPYGVLWSGVVFDCIDSIPLPSSLL